MEASRARSRNFDYKCQNEATSSLACLDLVHCAVHHYEKGRNGSLERAHKRQRKKIADRQYRLDFRAILSWCVCVSEVNVLLLLDIYGHVKSHLNTLCEDGLELFVIDMLVMTSYMAFIVQMWTLEEFK